MSGTIFIHVPFWSHLTSWSCQLTVWCSASWRYRNLSERNGCLGCWEGTRDGLKHFINCDFTDRSCDAYLAKPTDVPAKFTRICWIFRHPYILLQIFPQTGDTLATRCHVRLGPSILPSLKLLPGNCQFNRFQGLWLCLVMYLQSCSRWFGIDFGMWTRIHMAFRMPKTTGMIMLCSVLQLDNKKIHPEFIKETHSIPRFSAALRAMPSREAMRFNDIVYFTSCSPQKPPLRKPFRKIYSAQKQQFKYSNDLSRFLNVISILNTQTK